MAEGLEYGAPLHAAVWAIAAELDALEARQRERPNDVGDWLLGQYAGMRHAAAYIAGACGFTGPDAILNLRTAVMIERNKYVPLTGSAVPLVTEHAYTPQPRWYGLPRFCPCDTCGQPQYEHRSATEAVAQ